MDRLLSWFKKPPAVDDGARAPLPPGGRVDGFTLGEVLGDGGTATVYRAVDAEGREAAVKIPHLALIEDREFVETFRREAEIGVSLRHPSIVKVLQAGVYGKDEVPWFAMELLQGRDLRSLLAEEGPLPPERVAQISRGVADALEWAHHRGVVHRDVSPGNVFLTNQRGVKVMDFGIGAASWARPGRQVRGMKLGTPEYLAPERLADSRSADPRVDLYSLGCVMFEMLEGHPPFRASSPEEVLRRQRDAPVPPFTRPVPARLAAVVRRLLEKDPARRYASAREVMVDLAELT